MSIKNEQRIPQDEVIATIAAGTSLSDVVELGGLRPFRVKVPAGWMAAKLTYQVSENGVDFVDLYKSGAAVETIVTAGKSNLVDDPIDFASVRYLRVRSGTPDAPVAQVAAQELTLILRGI